MTTPTLEMIAGAFHPLRDKRLLDVGCGSGRLVRTLCSLGASAIGLDPDESAIAAARRAAPGSRFVRGGAEALPFDSQAFDGVIFLNSLHHVSVAKMAAALDEAARVLCAEARLIVVEPLPEGSFFRAFQIVEDETAVRAAAQAALERAPQLSPLLLEETRHLMRCETFRDLDHFAERIAEADSSRKPIIQEKYSELGRAFHRHATHENDGFLLLQPLLAHIFSKRASGSAIPAHRYEE
jgi:ubiquinone/menaquinone biosynthesis C-methylase UbiE